MQNTQLSNCEWIDNVPQSWTIVPLKYTAIGNGGCFIDGDWIESKDIDTDGIKYLTTGNVGANVYKEQGSGYISEATFKKLGCKDVYPGDLLISRLNEPIARTCIVPDLGQRIVTAVDNVIYRPNPNLVERRYICYYLNSARFTEHANVIARGATMHRISRTMLGHLKVLLPPIEEQKAIATYLDDKCAEIDNAIAIQKHKLDCLQEIKRNLVTATLTKGLNKKAELKETGIPWIGAIPINWEIRSLKFLCKPVKYAIKTGPFGTQLKGEDLKSYGDVRVYNQRNVLDCQFETVQYYVTTEKAKNLSSFITQPNDLLITSRGTIGRCSILPADAEMGILHPCLIALRIDSARFNLNWLKLFLNDSECFSTNVFLNSNATTIEVIYTDTLKSIKIPVPPKAEQDQIVNYLCDKLKRIEDSIIETEKIIESLKEYKQSLITEVVTGKRKVC